MKTNWDKFYEKLQKDPGSRTELEKAGRALDIAMQIYSLRKKRGLSQKQLAELIEVKQSNIARLEDADYEGYSLKTLEKIAEALDATIDVTFIPREAPQNSAAI